MGKRASQQLPTVGQVTADQYGFPGYTGDLLTPRKRAASRTALINRVNERKLYSLAMARFRWDGFPTEVNVRWLEMALMDSALSIYFKHPFGKFMAARGNPSGNVNMVGEPTEYTVWGNGLQAPIVLNIEDCVPIWANFVRIPDIDLIRLYASRLSELDRTIEINAKNARISKFVAIPENARLTAAQVMERLDAGDNALEIADSFDMSQIEVLDLGVSPESINALSMLRSRLFMEALNALGINMANQDKKERLVAAEVGANDDYVAMVREENLVARQLACDQISEIFSQEITVEYRTDHQTGALVDKAAMGGQQPQQMIATPARKAIEK